MSFENLEINNEPDDEAKPPEEIGNRTFLLLAGILGSVALLALVCIAVYALVILPRNRTAQDNQRATLDAQNTAVSNIIAQTSTAEALKAVAAAYTRTPTPTQPMAVPTASSSPTPVFVIPTKEVIKATDMQNPQTATANALFATLDANATRLAGTFTARPAQATSIPNTGFADDVGIPAMLGMAALLIGVIFLVRRLRTA